MYTLYVRNIDLVVPLAMHGTLVVCLVLGPGTPVFAISGAKRDAHLLLSLLMRGPIQDPPFPFAISPSPDRSYCRRSLSRRSATLYPALPRPWFIHDAGRYRGGSFQRLRISHAICAARRRRSEVCRSYLMRRHVRARPKNILVYLLSNQHGRRRSV